MSFFDRFRKKKKIDSEIKSDYTDEERYCCFDKAEYQFEKAMSNYRRESGNPVALSDDDFDTIYLYAGNHIGFFLTWIIKNHFEGEIHRDDAEGLEAVRNEKMTGTEFLMNYCDGKFLGEDVSDEIFGFVNEYYRKQYLSDYADFVLNVLNDLPLEFIGTWEEYHEFESVIDRAYEDYKNRV